MELLSNNVMYVIMNKIIENVFCFKESLKKDIVCVNYLKLVLM